MDEENNESPESLIKGVTSVVSMWSFFFMILPESKLAALQPAVQQELIELVKGTDEGHSSTCSSKNREEVCSLSCNALGEELKLLRKQVKEIMLYQKYQQSGVQCSCKSKQ